jgi:hypothetical protein
MNLALLLGYVLILLERPQLAQCISHMVFGKFLGDVPHGCTDRTHIMSITSANAHAFLPEEMMFHLLLHWVNCVSFGNL